MVATEDPRADRIAERNAFYESLAGEAKERFLGALQAASERGLDEEIAWREAVIAAETAYSVDRPNVPEFSTTPEETNL